MKKTDADKKFKAFKRFKKENPDAESKSFYTGYNMGWKARMKKEEKTKYNTEDTE